jgi:hypothetical protein
MNTVGGDEDRHLPEHQIGGERRQSIVLPVRKPGFDHNVPALHIAGFRKAPAKYLLERRCRSAAPKYPITGIVRCCPREPSGQMAAAMATSARNSRRSSLPNCMSF